MKLGSYGCSFVYGNDLSSTDLTWPALIARDLGLEYQCCATPGCGNLQILESIMLHSSSHDAMLINWTWIDRFDFVNCHSEQWQTLRPALDHDHADFYFKNLHSQYRDMLTNLIYISTAIDFLGSQNKKFVMTYMDDLLFENVRPEWHQPDAVTYLQQIVRPHMLDFERLNFLDWSRSRHFPISAAWHPLEQAHAAAAKLMMPTVSAMLNRD